MQFQTQLLLAISAATASAWTVPAGQHDGVYSVSTATDGSTTHTLISNDKKLAARSISRHRMSKRDFKGIDCGVNVLEASDITGAMNKLAAQCGKDAAVGGDLDFYSIYGGTVAFFCNLSGDAALCSANAANSDFGSIQSLCHDHGGWFTHPNYVYGYEATGSNFCGRGT